MPIKIPDTLPAKEVLIRENIFVMDETRAYTQDIRPIKIVILNLMPTKIVTETQLLRLLSNTPLQVDVTLLHMSTHESRNTPKEHLIKFYNVFDDIRSEKFDGMIITGAPVEHLDFEEVDYFDELKEILDWTLENVYSTMFICWGAQAALYHFYGIPKVPLEKKMFGVFPHRVLCKDYILLRGFDDVFYAPHSRHTGIERDALEQSSEVKILAESEEAGLYLMVAHGERQIFITGHPEYDPLTLKQEYERDIARGLPIDIPINYFPGDNPENYPIVNWRAHANLLFSNWLNYFLYQETPYDLNELPKILLKRRGKNG